MSDPAPPVRPDGPAPDAAAPLTPAAIERVLADFRTWLTDLAVAPSPPAAEPPAVDLHTLVAQFTALRHEVNLQTKAARTSIEQNGEALKTLEGAVAELRDRPAEADNAADPLLKALVDVYDNLALALRQVEKQRGAIDGPLAEWADSSDVPEVTSVVEAGPPGVRPGFLRRLIGWYAVQPFRDPEIQATYEAIKSRHERAVSAAKLARSSFDGLIAGYRMSLARVDRAIEQAGLETIATVGESFDPELMEVVEVVGNSDRPVGEVIEEVRRGYLREDVVYRYAQVKVAR